MRLRSGRVIFPIKTIMPKQKKFKDKTPRPCNKLTCVAYHKDIDETIQSLSQEVALWRAKFLHEQAARAVDCDTIAALRAELATSRPPQVAEGQAGPRIVLATNFAPGTTAADIIAVMRHTSINGDGQQGLISCHIISPQPVVIAELIVTEPAIADRLVSAYNNQLVDGHYLKLHLLRQTDLPFTSVASIIPDRHRGGNQDQAINHTKRLVSPTPPVVTSRENFALPMHPAHRFPDHEGGPDYVDLELAHRARSPRADEEALIEFSDDSDDDGEDNRDRLSVQDFGSEAGCLRSPTKNAGSPRRKQRRDSQTWYTIPAKVFPVEVGDKARTETTTGTMQYPQISFGPVEAPTPTSSEEEALRLSSNKEPSIRAVDHGKPTTAPALSERELHELRALNASCRIFPSDTEADIARKLSLRQPGASTSRFYELKDKQRRYWAAEASVSGGGVSGWHNVFN
jgi:hypothetical protein